MEYCSLGDLSTYIKRTDVPKTGFGGLPEPLVLDFVKQLGEIAGRILQSIGKSMNTK